MQEAIALELWAAGSRAPASLSSGGSGKESNGSVMEAESAELRGKSYIKLSETCGKRGRCSGRSRAGSIVLN